MENDKGQRPQFRPNPDLRLMDQVREVLRYHHYAYLGQMGSDQANPLKLNY